MTFFLFYFLLSTEKFRKETMAMALVLHFNSKSKQTECFPKTLQLHHDKLTREALVPTAKSFAPFLCKKTNCDFITKGHKATQCQLLIVNNTAEHRNSTLPKQLLLSAKVSMMSQTKQPAAEFPYKFTSPKKKL